MLVEFIPKYFITKSSNFQTSAGDFLQI